MITEGAKIVDAGDRSFVNFIDLCRVEFLFFFREIVEKRKVYLFILFLISEKFITSGLLLLFIVIKEKYLDRINFQSTIRQEKKSKKKNFGLNVLFAQRKWDLDS